MEALIELCDLIAENPVQFAVKLSWICDKCPPPEFLSAGSPRLSRSHLNAVLAVARFLSRCPNFRELRPKSVVIEFLRSIPHSFTPTFWPRSFNVDSISSFFVDFLGYVSKAAESSPGLADEVAGLFGDVVISAISNSGEHSSLVRAFLVALSQSFVPISSSDVDKLVICLIDHFAFPIPVPGTPREHIAVNSDTLSSQSPPLKVNHHSQASPGNEISNVSGSSSGTDVLIFILFQE